MNGASIDPKVKTRRALVRAVLAVVYLGLIALVFSLGKGHTIILDNKDSDDGSIKALESLTVSVDGQEPIDLSSGDRDMAKVHGQGHQVEITVKDAQKVTHQVHVPLGEDMVLLSLPALLSGAPSSLIPFVPKEIAAPADDQGNNNSFTSPDAPAVPGAPPAPGAPVVP